MLRYLSTASARDASDFVILRGFHSFSDYRTFTENIVNDVSDYGRALKVSLLFSFARYRAHINWIKKRLNEVATPLISVARRETYRGRSFSRTIAFDIARFPVAFLLVLYRQHVTDARSVVTLRARPIASSIK